MSHAQIQNFCDLGRGGPGPTARKQLILFDEKGLFGLFGVLVNLFEGVIILFFTKSGV